MIASSFDFAGLGTVLVGSAALVSAFGTLRIQRKTHAVATKTSVVVKETAADVKQVDRAVNGKPPGSSTLVEQVGELYGQAFPQPEPFTNGGAILPTLARIEQLLREARGDVKGTDDAP